MAARKETTQTTWREGMTFDATTTTGHHLVMDSTPPAGNDNGPKPIELLLTALAGCTGMDVLSILKKKRQPVEGLRVVVEGTRPEEHPRAYTEIQVTYYVRGNVAPAAIARAIELSEIKYCGVSAMLASHAHITSRFEIEPPAAAGESAPQSHDMHVTEPENISEALP